MAGAIWLTARSKQRNKHNKLTTTKHINKDLVDSPIVPPAWSRPKRGDGWEVRGVANRLRDVRAESWAPSRLLHLRATIF